MSKERLTLGVRVVQSQAVLSADVGEVVVLLHTERNAYYDTDAVGAEVWRRIASPVTIEEICASMQEQYEVDRETCQADVLAFLEEGVTEGIVCVEAGGPAAQP